MALSLNNHQLHSNSSGERKVPVVYYLCCNGKLDHPHFIEVSLSSHKGLYLRDVINRLNDLRGKGMASLYSWSSKRIYKNGFVWHDLSADDLIFPVHGQGYVLKGSQILDLHNSGKGSGFPSVTHRRNQSWSSFDLTEYKVYKASESNAESTRKLATDASTQTDDRRRRKKPVKDEEESSVNEITELSREEISPPQSDSSPETLETLMKADGRLILRPEDQELNRTVERMRASTVLMQLISCGAMSFKKCRSTLLTGPTGGKPDYRLEMAEKELRNSGRVKLEEKKELVPSFKRSSSYNTKRSSMIESKIVVDSNNKAKPGF